MSEAVSEFLAQGGYAGFVWGAYGMVAALLVAEILGLKRQRRTILTRLGRLMRLRARRDGGAGDRGDTVGGNE